MSIRDAVAKSVDLDQTVPSGGCSLWSSLTWVCTVSSDLSVLIVNFYSIVLVLISENGFSGII